jgi:hypothetical protein
MIRKYFCKFPLFRLTHVRKCFSSDLAALTENEALNQKRIQRAIVNLDVILNDEEYKYNFEKRPKNMFDERKDVRAFYSFSLDLMRNLQNSSHASEFLRNQLVYFIEKNVEKFNLAQLFHFYVLPGDARLGYPGYYQTLSEVIGRKLSQGEEGRAQCKSPEDIDFSSELMHFFKTSSELGFTNQLIVNYVLEYFTSFSLNLLSDDTNRLYDFMWLFSMSLASIINQKPKEKYPNNTRIISEKGAVALKKIINFLNINITQTQSNNFSAQAVSKIRLYKSLRYLELEGCQLPENIVKFLNSFEPFYTMNMEVQKNKNPSSLEMRFARQFLYKHPVYGDKYEKEYKTEFGSVDFFIHPNIIIEVNGPLHYLKGDNITLLGKDQLKTRALTLLGYEIYTSDEWKKKNEVKKLI